MFAVNFHFLRGCNMRCEYCFHSNPSLRGVAQFAPALDAERCVRGIDLLVRSGCTKLNFAGGEPFLYPSMLFAMASYAKSRGLYTSVITNGLLAEPHEAFDMMGVSVDSFDDETNRRIGRTTLDIGRLRALRDGSRAFKINTVVSRLNLDEDFNSAIEDLAPDRWKAFQVLTVPSQNAGHGTSITKDEFDGFVRRHPRAIAESNAVMKDSYLILDEELRFLDGETKQPIGNSIFDDPTAIETAVARMDLAAFRARQGGFYL